MNRQDLRTGNAAFTKDALARRMEADDLRDKIERADYMANDAFQTAKVRDMYAKMASDYRAKLAAL